MNLMFNLGVILLGKLDAFNRLSPGLSSWCFSDEIVNSRSV